MWKEQCAMTVTDIKIKNQELLNMHWLKQLQCIFRH